MHSTAKNIDQDEYYKVNPYMSDERLKKVFIIEDNEMHSMMMDYILSKENSFNIFRFKSGEECIKKLNLRPDIIILDYGLPGIDGLETFKQIKEYNSKIPVVVITENSNNGIAKEFKDNGAYEYIVKDPNSFLKLSQVIESILVRLSEREYMISSRNTALLVGGFVFLILLSSLVSYLVLKH